MKRQFLILLVFSTFFAQQSFAQMPPPPPMAMQRVISVSGEAREEIAPDQAILSVSLVSRNADLNEAKTANDKLSEQVVAALREFKIPREKIANSYFYISPEYRYENNKQRLIGYVVNRSLRITMDELAIHERVLSKLVELKVDQVGGVEFTLKDRDAVTARVRARAFDNAKMQAEAMTKAAGMQVGRPLTISAGSGGFAPPHPMPVMRGMVAMEAKADASVAPSLPGLITISENVSVTFEME